MNILILLAAFIVAYLGAKAFDYFSECFEKYQFKRFYQNDLNKYRAGKIYKMAKNFYISQGFNTEDAEIQTIIYLEDIRKNKQLEEKYKLLKGG